MTSREQTFRVFRCPHCGYTGYKLVHSEEDDSTCNLCSKTISPTLEMKHVRTLDDAKFAVQSIVLKKQPPKAKSRHGLGLKKRIFNIISDLSDLNRGRGVSRDRVLGECREADMDIDRAKMFLNQLREEGLIIEVEGHLAIVREEGDENEFCDT